MGSWLVIFSAFGFSTLGIFGKLAYQAGFTRNQMLFWRFTLSLPLLLGVLKLARAKVRSRRALASAIALGAIGIGLEATLFFLTLELVGASLTGVFLYLYPAFVALLSRVFLKRALSGVQWLCIALSLAGCVLTVNPFGQSLSPWGIVWGVLTGFWYAVYLLAGERLTQDEDPLVVSSGIVLGAAIAFGAFGVADWALGTVPVAFPVPGSWNRSWPIVGMAIFASVLPFTTLYAGMKRVGATQASVLSTLELVFTIILAALFLGEKLTPVQIVGSALVLSSVLLIQKIK